MAKKRLIGTVVIDGRRYGIYDDDDGKELAELGKLVSRKPDINDPGQPITVYLKEK